MKKKWICCFCLFMSFCFQSYSLDRNVFEWGLSKPEMTSYEKLKERWVYSLLQECVRSKIEKECLDRGIPYEITIEEGLLPCHFSGAILADESVYLETLEKIKLEIDLNFSSHFDALHGIWSEWIQAEKQTLSRKHMNESVFFYDKFLEHSELILQDLKLDDLITALDFNKIDPVLEFAQKKSQFSFREDVSSHSSFIPIKKGWESAQENGRGGEPKSEEAKLFFNLPLTDEDKVLIRKIITSMADKNVLQLLMDKKSMERKGDKVRPVHPMRFIGFVLADPNLRRCMKSISKATFKWSGFLDGYEKRMKEESRIGNLSCYSAGLADLLEVDKSVIQHYINHSNYEGLVKHFL